MVFGPAASKGFHRRSGRGASLVETEESFSGHTLLDIDATIAKPAFKPPISMKAMQNEPWMRSDRYDKMCIIA